MNKNKGITLIALVITIIVLLILAGISIAMLTGENGILTQANNAKEQSIHAQVKEALQLAHEEYTIEEALKKEGADTKKTFSEYLIGKNYIDATSRKVNVSNLVGSALDLGNGEGKTDVYILDENYHLYYYENESTNVDLGIIGAESGEIIDEDAYELTEEDATIDENGEISISEDKFYQREDFDSKTIKIPSIIDGKQVKKLQRNFLRAAKGIECVILPEGLEEIGQNAFTDCSDLKSINIPNSLTTIGSYVFKSCTSLTSINIPDGVTLIKNGTFQGCTSLASINIPSSVTAIGYDAFDSCTSLASISISEGVTSIGSYAFQDCTSLASINIPNSVTLIENHAFDGCTSLTSITIPESVTNIGSSIFSNCINLETIDVDINNIKYESPNNCNAIIEKETKTLIVGCKNTTIPNSVKIIGDYAFYYCTSLTSINIPDSVTSIGFYTFAYCTSLTNIFIPQTVTSMSTYVFCGWKSNQTIKVETASKPSGWEDFWNNACSATILYSQTRPTQ